MSKKSRWGTLDPFFESGDVLGRKVANAGFAHALFTIDPFDEYHFFLPDKASAAAHMAFLQNAFPKQAKRHAFRCHLQLDLHNVLGTTLFHAFHLSDCFTHMAQVMRIRNVYAPEIFPVTGVTHSLSYARYIPYFFEHIWPGVSDRDRIIATSKSAELMVEATFSRLIKAYGLQKECGRHPSVARIPLGAEPSQENKATLNSTKIREELGIKTELVFLCLARISLHSKMDILPLLAAFHQAKEFGLLPESYVFILAGWSASASCLPSALQSYASQLGIRLIPYLCPSDEEKQALYSIADVFLSPSDNIQETFGLTLLEAGSFGLPSIASDFDGYRDIIIHGETGFLVPTLGFSDTQETNVLAGVWEDTQYHLKLSQETVVDIRILAKYLARIAGDNDLRKIMGKKARERFSSHFAWPVVIEKYLSLWESLRNIPVSMQERARLLECVHPLQPDFADSFQGHFTQTLTGMSLERRVELSPLGKNVYKRLLPMVSYVGQEQMLDSKAFHTVLFLARKPVTIRSLLATTEKAIEESSVFLFRGGFKERAAFVVLWAIKHGYISFLAGGS